MTRTFNDELLKYSGDQELLAKLDELWERNRQCTTFLHEVPPKYLRAFIDTVEGLLNGMTLVPTKEWEDYRKLSTDTTHRLSYALGFMRDLVDRNRGFSRAAIRGWIATLSAPLEERSTEEVKREVTEAPKGVAELNPKDSPKPAALKTESECMNEQQLCTQLFFNEVYPKLSNLMLGLRSGLTAPTGAMNVEEIKTLSACLDVALRARDDKQ